jgi:flagellar basal-body rod modification protein FlgD
MTVAAISAVTSGTGVLGTATGRARTENGTSGTGTSGTGTSGTGTSGTSGTGSSGATGSGSSATSNQTLDRDTFLKLLVAQLKYQDPSKPVDASAMISQSAELSVVEKLDDISKALSDSQATNRLTLGGSMIGKQVTFAGTGGTPVTAVVSSVTFDGSSLVLKAGTWDVPIAAVTSIAAAPTGTPVPPTTVTGTSGTGTSTTGTGTGTTGTGTTGTGTSGTGSTSGNGTT